MLEAIDGVLGTSRRRTYVPRSLTRREGEGGGKGCCGVGGSLDTADLAFRETETEIEIPIVKAGTVPGTCHLRQAPEAVADSVAAGPQGPTPPQTSFDS